MAMVGVASGSLQADSQPGSFGLVWGSAAAWRLAIFITWTGWTLAVAFSYDDSTINIVVGIIIIIITRHSLCRYVRLSCGVLCWLVDGVLWCGRIIEQPNGVVTVKAVDGDHCLAHVNPTARKALYQPNKDKPLTANCKHLILSVPWLINLAINWLIYWE